VKPSSCPTPSLSARRTSIQYLSPKSRKFLFKKIEYEDILVERLESEEIKGEERSFGRKEEDEMEPQELTCTVSRWDT
jgi:hypothetical protein